MAEALCQAPSPSPGKEAAPTGSGLAPGRRQKGSAQLDLWSNEQIEDGRVTSVEAAPVFLPCSFKAAPDLTRWKPSRLQAELAPVTAARPHTRGEDSPAQQQPGRRAVTLCSLLQVTQLVQPSWPGAACQARVITRLPSCQHHALRLMTSPGIRSLHFRAQHGQQLS